MGIGIGLISDKRLCASEGKFLKEAPQGFVGLNVRRNLECSVDGAPESGTARLISGRLTKRSEGLPRRLVVSLDAAKIQEGNLAPGQKDVVARMRVCVERAKRI